MGQLELGNWGVDQLESAGTRNRQLELGMQLESRKDLLDAGYQKEIRLEGGIQRGTKS